MLPNPFIFSGTEHGIFCLEYLGGNQLKKTPVVRTLFLWRFLFSHFSPWSADRRGSFLQQPQGLVPRGRRSVPAQADKMASSSSISQGDRGFYCQKTLIITELAWSLWRISLSGWIRDSKYDERRVMSLENESTPEKAPSLTCQEEYLPISFPALLHLQGDLAPVCSRLLYPGHWDGIWTRQTLDRLTLDTHSDFPKHWSWKYLGRGSERTY